MITRQVKNETILLDVKGNESLASLSLLVVAVSAVIIIILATTFIHGWLAIMCSYLIRYIKISALKNYPSSKVFNKVL